MRIFHELVISDFMAGTGQYFSKFQWAAVMGNMETLCFVVVADEVSGTSPTLYLALLETPDISLEMNTAKTLLNSVALNPGQPNTFALSVSDADVGMPASYAYQLVYALGGTSPSARVRIWVTGRGKA